MYTKQQRILYAKQLKRLHELYVIKSNIHLTYKYKNQNKAIHNAHSLQDKIINAIIDDAVYGNGDKIRNIDSTISELMTTTLENERKRIHHKNDRYVDRAVELNAEKYSQILSNRINTEAIKLQRKIESELASGIHNDLSEAQTRRALKEKYGDTAKARIRNIIRDGVHTNESNISWINALNEGYSYKVWMNGRGKGKVRRWHRANIIAPVPIDEYFDLHGSYPAQAMYPGDLYAGAENVANCRCWLRYTNRRPEGLGEKKTVFNIPQTSYLNTSNNTSKNTFSEKVKLKPIETIKTTISNTTEKVTSKIKKITKKITSTIKTPKIKSKKFAHDTNFKNTRPIKKTPYGHDKTKSVKVGEKTVYGVGESPKDKLNFEREYGVKISDLTKDEYNFIRLYSGDGFSLLNNYLREIANVTNPRKLKFIKRKYSIKWLKLIFIYPREFISFEKSLNVLEKIFDKGKILEEDLVVVRRQKKPMTDYADNGIYHSDSCLSTSISKNVKPDEYGNYVHYIVIQKGTKILYIEGITTTKGEYELLLDKNIDLEIIRNKSKFESHWKIV